MSPKKALQCPSGRPGLQAFFAKNLPEGAKKAGRPGRPDGHWSAHCSSTAALLRCSTNKKIRAKQSTKHKKLKTQKQKKTTAYYLLRVYEYSEILAISSSKNK